MLVKKRLKVLILLSLMAVALLSFSIADVGNFNTYDSDWGSDWSSSDWDYDYDSDWDYGGSGGGNSIFEAMMMTGLIEEGDTLIPIFIVAFIVIGILCYITTPAADRKRWHFSAPRSNPVRTNLYQQNVVPRIQQNDTYFSEEKFKTWVNEVFIKLQAAWTARDWSGIRPFESEELFSLHKSQLQQYIDMNRINVIERVSVRSTELINYSADGDKELLVVNLQATMKDYIVDANTKAVLEGDPNRYWEMKYYLTFMRKNGVKTDPSTSNKSTTNCPNCGAPTEVTSAGQCPYCRSVITTGEHDWVLTKMESHR